MGAKECNVWTGAASLYLLACMVISNVAKFGICTGVHALAPSDLSLSQGKTLGPKGAISVALAIPYQDAQRLAASLEKRNDNRRAATLPRTIERRSGAKYEEKDSSGHKKGGGNGGVEERTETGASSSMISSMSSSSKDINRPQSRKRRGSTSDSPGSRAAVSISSSDCAFADWSVAYTLVVYFPLGRSPLTGVERDRKEIERDSNSDPMIDSRYPGDREKAAREAASSLTEHLQRRHPGCFLGHRTVALDLGEVAAQRANVLAACRACASFYSLFESLHGIFEYMLLVDRSSKPLHPQWLRAITKEIHNGFIDAGSEFWVRGASQCSRSPSGASSSGSLITKAFAPQLAADAAVSATNDVDSALYDRVKSKIALDDEAISFVTTAATAADAVSTSITVADAAVRTTVIHRNSIYNLRDGKFRAFLGAVREFFEGGTDGCPSGCATGRVEEHGAEHCMARYLALDPRGDAHELRPYFQATLSMVSLCPRDDYTRGLGDMEPLRLDAIRERYPRAMLALVDPGSSALALVRRAFLDIWQDDGRNFDRAVQVNFTRALEASSDGGVRVMREIETYLCSHTRYGKNVDLYQSSRCLRLCERDPVFAAAFTASTCKYFKRREEWRKKFPGKAYIWTADLHSGPVSCDRSMMTEAGAVIHAEIQFNKCHFSGVCGGRLRVFKNDFRNEFFGQTGSMEGYSLGEEPNSMRRRFFEAYKHDPEFARVDAFLCTHPTANCELFMPFNKSIIINAAARIEFGRYDEHIPWRKKKLTDRSFYRWQQWKRNLQRIAAHPHNIIMANNLYDVEYIRHVSGVKAHYMPAWCGDDNAKYAPSNKNILVGPYRLPEPVQTYKDGPWKHPIMTGLQEAREKSKARFNINLLGETYRSYTFGDLSAHPAIIFLPYQVSIMSFFEYYRLGIPLYIPSKALLLEWDEKYDLMDERIYGFIPGDSRSPVERRNDGRFTATAGLPDPNVKANLKHWIDLCDFYVFPHVQYFDSWDDLFRQLRTADLKTISSDMMRHSEKQRDEILAKWKSVLQRVVPPDNEGPRVVPEDFDVAMNSLYGIPTMGPDLPQKSTW